jgi:hypothetical protein
MGRPPKSERTDPRKLPGAFTQDEIDAFAAFDFDAFWQAVKRGEHAENMTPAMHSMMKMLNAAVDVYVIGRWPPAWILNDLIFGHMRVLRGEAWPEAFPLPWLDRLSLDAMYGKAQNKDFWMANRVLALTDTRTEFIGPMMTMTAAKKLVAGNFNTSIREVERACREERLRLGSPVKTRPKQKS